MKNLNNAHEENTKSLKERVLCEVGKKLAKMAVDPRVCWGSIIYERELPDEIIREISEKQ